MMRVSSLKHFGVKSMRTGSESFMWNQVQPGISYFLSRICTSANIHRRCFQLSFSSRSTGNVRQKSDFILPKTDVPAQVQRSSVNLHRAIIQSFANIGETGKSLKWVEELERRDSFDPAIDFDLLKELCESVSIQLAGTKSNEVKLHADMKKLFSYMMLVENPGSVIDPKLLRHLFDVYLKQLCDTDGADKFFKESSLICEPRIESYNALMSVYLRWGESHILREKIEEIFYMIQASNLTPNQETFEQSLKSCLSLNEPMSFDRRLAKKYLTSFEKMLGNEKITAHVIDFLFPRSRSIEKLEGEVEIKKIFSNGHIKFVKEFNNVRSTHRDNVFARTRIAEELDEFIAEMSKMGNFYLQPTYTTHCHLAAVWSRTRTIDGLLKAERHAMRSLNITLASKKKVRIDSFYPVLHGWLECVDDDVDIAERITEWVDTLKKYGMKDENDYQEVQKLYSIAILAWRISGLIKQNCDGIDDRLSNASRCIDLLESSLRFARSSFDYDIASFYHVAGALRYVLTICEQQNLRSDDRVYHLINEFIELISDLSHKFMGDLTSLSPEDKENVLQAIRLRNSMNCLYTETILLIRKSEKELLKLEDSVEFRIKHLSNIEQVLHITDLMNSILNMAGYDNDSDNINFHLLSPTPRYLQLPELSTEKLLKEVLITCGNFSTLKENTMFKSDLLRVIVRCFDSVVSPSQVPHSFMGDKSGVFLHTVKALDKLSGSLTNVEATMYEELKHVMRRIENGIQADETSRFQNKKVCLDILRKHLK